MIRKVWSKRLKRYVWRYDVRINKRRHRDSFHKEEDCINALASLRMKSQRIKYGLEPEEKRAVTLAQLTAARTKDIMPEYEKATRTRRADVKILKEFLKQAPQGITVEKIATAHLKAFADKLGESVAPRTVNRRLAAVYAMLNAAGIYFVELSSYRPPKNPRVKTPSRGRERVITLDELANLFAELWKPQHKGEHLYRTMFRHATADALEIALLTGRRKSEILSLRRDQVNLNWRTLKIENKKSGTVQLLPLSDALYAILERRMKASTHPLYLFPDRYNKSHQKRFDRSIRQAAVKAGVPYGSKVENGFIFHDARHTATSSMLQDQTDIATVQGVTGHSTKEMVMHYSHASRESLQRAMDTLAQRLESVRLESAKMPEAPELPQMPEAKADVK